VSDKDALRHRLRESAAGGDLPCALAHRLAESCATSPRAVGETADVLGIRVTLCQLGLFGYEEYGDKRWICIPATIPGDLAAALREACVDGRLPCAAAWRLADEHGLPRLLVGFVSEAVDVRISACQLGCF
jgi:hypothetical protein